MLLHNKLPPSKDELYSFLCNISRQNHIETVIIDLTASDKSILFYNKVFSELTGYNDSELIGKNLSFLQGLKTDTEILLEIEESISNGCPFEANIIHYKKDSSAFWNQISGYPIKDHNNRAQFMLLHCKDITDAMLAKMLSKLEHEVYIELDKDCEFHEILQLITEKVETYYIRNIYCAIHVIQENGKLKAIASGSLPLNSIDSLCGFEIGPTTGFNENAVYIKEFAHSENNFNLNCRKLISDYNLLSCWTKPLINNDHHLLGTFTIYIKKDVPLKQSDIDFLNKLSPIVSLSMKYFKQKQELKKLAFFDLSTGIPNFNYFITTLSNWIKQNTEGSVLIIQPSEYSSIVDLYGRKVGDDLIRKILERIQQQLMTEDDFIYGRFSNSSLIIGQKISKKIDTFITQLIQLTSLPYAIAERDIFITFKIGISHFHQSISIDESIRQADIALTKSRHRNGTVVSFFDQDMDDKIQRELDILNELTYALQSEEFTIHLQPKVNLKTAEIEGFEALARWYSPKLGQVSPIEFIPIAEQAGKIREIDNIVLKKVLQWQQKRNSSGCKIFPVAVNISPTHFYHESFVDDFISLVKKYKICSEFIKVEVTENAELFDFSKAKDILLKLKEYGYECSIDDFGVGFSSLSYLQQLPFSEIKIDRSFIKGIDDNGMYAVVKTIVQLAASLNMHAVAEGIETFQQFATLQEMGCHTGQGYYFHKPMPIEDAETLLNSIK